MPKSPEKKIEPSKAASKRATTTKEVLAKVAARKAEPANRAMSAKDIEAAVRRQSTDSNN